MSDLGTRIRSLLDETAPPIEGTGIVRRTDRRETRPRWVAALAAALGVLIVGAVTYFAIGWGTDRPPSGGTATTFGSTTETTVTTPQGASSTTSPSEAEAARAQEEARRRAAEAAARQAAAEQVPYLGFSLPGWEFSRAGELVRDCLHSPPLLLKNRQATYVATDTADRSINLNVFPRLALCSPEEAPSSTSDLGPPASPPNVVDHGMTTMMGHEARVVDENGVYRVLWLLDDQGSHAELILFPGSAPLTLQDVLALTEGVVELTHDQWDQLLSASTTTP